MKITSKLVAGISIPPAAVITTGAILLTKDNNSNQIPEQEAPEVNVQQPLNPPPAPPPNPNPPPLRKPPRPLPDDPPVVRFNSSEPSYFPTFYTDEEFQSKSDSDKNRSNVYQHQSSESLLNADPKFKNDNDFVTKWTQKFNYLNQQKENNLVKSTVFQEALSSYTALSDKCRDAYMKSNDVIRTGTKTYWKHPDASIKDGQVLETYWQAVWHFCTVPHLNTKVLNRIPDNWGGVKARV